MKGIKIKKNKNNGYAVLYLHYSSDPLKDEEWVEAEKRAYPNPNAWKRMYEIDFTGIEGTPVYPTFSREKHIGIFKHNALKPLYRSWEFGVDTAVCKVYQHDQWDRVILLAECVKRKIESFRAFVAETLQWCDKHFDKHEDEHGRIISLEWEDFGDFAGTYQSDGKGQVYVEILTDFGISVITSPFGKTTKLRAIEHVNQRLNEEVVIKENKDGTQIKTPKFLTDKSCEISIEAYAGGYVYGKETSRGLKPLDPNHPYEDVCDADHYFVINKFELIRPTEESKKPMDIKIDPITGWVR